jgi:hypothetical protein
VSATIVWTSPAGAALAAFLLSPLVAFAAGAEIPATPVMTVYQFNGPLDVPFYEIEGFARHGPSSAAGTLAQGTSVVPCLVIRAGTALTDGDGTPYVGFDVVVDARGATPESSARFAEVSRQRRAMTVANHHCPDGTAHVIDVRKLAALGKAPSFDPPRTDAPAAPNPPAPGDLDEIVRAFHASRHCEEANRRLIGRRDALARAWSAFVAESGARWPADRLARARQLDFVLRTALYEGHLGRGCNAYGACERNVIALSIRNRAVERCLAAQGCRSSGDFEGVAATVSQYNIWDEVLTQTTGLTSCFLRPDLADRAPYAKLRAIYEQSAADVERILYGGGADLRSLFAGSPPAVLTELRHYYHPPAMGKCFPDRRRLEYISGAVARRGDDFALLANTRVQVGERRGKGYLFREAVIADENDRDVVQLFDRHPGFVIDGRKVEMQAPTRCTPYGTPRQCRFQDVGRYRKTPSWLAQGKPLQLECTVRARGEDCRREARPETVRVGGICDTAMQPVAGVP